jgi:hypothetical protein
MFWTPTAEYSSNVDRNLAEQRHHIHECRQQEAMAKLQDKVKYCYLCFEFVAEGQWSAHCQHHLSSLDDDCGIYCINHHTEKFTVRPGFCPFCLSNQKLEPTLRWQFWTTPEQWASHVGSHIATLASAPVACPHSNCVLNLPGKEKLLQHLDIDHGVDRSLVLRHSLKRPYKSDNDPGTDFNNFHHSNKKTKRHDDVVLQINDSLSEDSQGLQSAVNQEPEFIEPSIIFSGHLDSLTPADSDLPSVPELLAKLEQAEGTDFDISSWTEY